MNGAVDRAIFLAIIVVFATTIDSFAQQGGAEAPPGLPPVIESLGSGDPPDLPPTFGGSSAGATVNDVQAPVLRKPVEPQVEAPRSSVLDTLDNLPPVGSAAEKPSNMPALPDFPSSEASGSGPAQAETQPRIVRFGDVRNESVARQQFPELRNRSSANPRDRTDIPGPAGRNDGGEPQSRGFLARLFPWRRQPPPEPPLLTRNPAEDRAARPGSPTPVDTVPGARNRTVAERIDQELRKKVERAARQAVGSRTNELDVQVIDEEIYLRARPMWFWQRRQITDELRNLQGFDPKRLHVTVY